MPPEQAPPSPPVPPGPELRQSTGPGLPPYPASPLSGPTYPAYPVYPAQSARWSAPPPSKALAGWSLGLAIFPSIVTWVIAVIFAIIVLSRSRDGRDHGKGLSTAALIVVAVWILVAVVVVSLVYSTGAHRDENGRVTDGGRASAFDLRVGDCLPAFEAGTARTVEVVDCGESHIGEVYATYELTGEFTTRDEVVDLVKAGCLDRFEAFDGIAPESSSLRLFYLFPQNQLTFSQHPKATCIAGTTEPTTGTLRGSRR